MEALDIPDLLRPGHQDPSSLPESLEGERRLVIAIDYGTTYTGVAFATPVDKRASLEDIEVILNWGPKMSNDEKIPSVYSYSLRTSKRERQWGADLSPQAIAMVHTKLQLDVDSTSKELDLILETLDGTYNLDFGYITNNPGEPKYPRRRPEEIVEDYLTKVFDHLLEEIERILTQALRFRISTDIIATIPAKWSYRAKNSTFRALTRAGFNSDNFPELRQMFLVSEPEAAAVYTARYLTEKEGPSFLKKNDCFILCDAGGGTVDVVSYKVKQVYPTFEIETVTLPTGDKCGAIFINLAFKIWLRDLIGGENYQKLDQGELIHKISSHDAEGERMRVLMKEFEIEKKRFRKGSGDIHMELPEPLGNLNIHERVNKGEITITYNDMQYFFESACATPIINLIQGQINQLEDQRLRLKNVFLVGGFAESPYLQDSIRGSLHLRGYELQIPDTSWTAVVRGAAIFGIEKLDNKSLAIMSACPRSYGVTVDELFSDVLHDKRDKVRDTTTNLVMAKEQMKWLIVKGDLILSNEPKEVKNTYTCNFADEGRKPSGSIPIYAYDKDDLPDRLANSAAELTNVHTILYDLKDIPIQEFERGQPASRPFFVARLQLIMRQDPRSLHVELKMKDRMIYSEDIPEPPIEE